MLEIVTVGTPPRSRDTLLDVPRRGTRHGRDVNAAKNIPAAGLAQAACEGGIRRTGTPRRGRLRNKVREEIPLPQGRG